MKQFHFYVEQYRQKNRTLLVTGPLQTIESLPAGLALTKISNCITIAVFKIRLKEGVVINQ